MSSQISVPGTWVPSTKYLSLDTGYISMNMTQSVVVVLWCCGWTFPHTAATYNDCMLLLWCTYRNNFYVYYFDFNKSIALQAYFRLSCLSVTMEMIPAWKKLWQSFGWFETEIPLASSCYSTKGALKNLDRYFWDQLHHGLVHKQTTVFVKY